MVLFSPLASNATRCAGCALLTRVSGRCDRVGAKAAEGRRRDSGVGSRWRRLPRGDVGTAVARHPPNSIRTCVPSRRRLPATSAEFKCAELLLALTIRRRRPPSSIRTCIPDVHGCDTSAEIECGRRNGRGARDPPKSTRFRNEDSPDIRGIRLGRRKPRSPDIRRIRNGFRWRAHADTSCVARPYARRVLSREATSIARLPCTFGRLGEHPPKSNTAGRDRDAVSARACAESARMTAAAKAGERSQLTFCSARHSRRQVEWGERRGHCLSTGGNARELVAPA